jgi:hypothetical protein
MGRSPRSRSGRSARRVIDAADRTPVAQLISQRTGAPADQVETMIAAWQNQYVAGPQLEG